MAMMTISSHTLIFGTGSFLPRYTCHIRKRPNNAYALQYMDGGGVWVVYDGTRYELEGAWFWLNLPEACVSYAPLDLHGYWSHRYLSFQGPLADVWRQRGWLFSHPVPAPVGVDWGARMDRLHALTVSPDASHHALAVNLLENIFLEVYFEHHRAHRYPEWLSRVLQELQKSTPPDYDELAASCAMAGRTFRRQFHAIMGISPHTYHCQYRITCACELLRDTTLPIKAIAEQSGYRDIYYFSREFRRVVGMPPAKYRRAPVSE